MYDGISVEKLRPQEQALNKGADRSKDRSMIWNLALCWRGDKEQFDIFETCLQELSL